jgi:lipopolysaccharide export system protein LptA
MRLPLLAALLAAVLASPAVGQDPRRPAPPPPPAARDTAGVPAGADSAKARPGQEADSVYQQLLKLEGYVPVEYEGKTAEFRADEGVLRLWGEAQVSREGEKLNADSIVYHERTQITNAFGNPRVSGKEQNIEGDVLVYDMERRLARIQGGRTQVAQGGATWHVRGDAISAEQETQRLYALNSTLTTDERPEPQYHFQVGKTKVVRDRLLVGRPAKLYFRNVPVAWLPFIVQDMEKGRRSGILTPRFGINDIVRTSSGYQRQISNVGYYWAISDYLGAQVSGEWRSNSYTSLLGSLDFNWKRQFLNGNVAYRQYFPDEGGGQNGLTANTSWRPDERTDLRLSASYASSSRFVRERSTNPLEAVQDLQSNLSLGRRFDWGQVSLQADRRQSLANERVEWTFPSFNLNPNTLTLFRSAGPDAARWYNDVSLTLGASGRFTGVDLPVATARDEQGVLRLLGERSTRQAEVGLNQSLTMGDLALSSSFSLNRQNPFEVADLDSLTLDVERGQWSSSLSYRIPVVGSSFISPTLQLSQEIRRDTLSRKVTGEDYVAGPTRLSFGASMNTDVFGFFPGVGPFERIRHHVRPGISYAYSPAVQQTALQDAVFGRVNALTQNRLTLTFDQTFEAKMRSGASRPVRQPGDTVAVDTAGAPADSAGRAQGSAPAEARKVTLLAINASALEYDFARAAQGFSGLVTDQISGSLRSDFLQGLNLQFGIDLFNDARPEELREDQQAHGGFAPQLSSLSTSFSFGQSSAIFRWLGDLFAGARGESMVPPNQMVPDTTATPASAPLGPTTATANPQRAGGGGPWNASVSYSLVRRRPGAFEAFAGGGQGDGDTRQTLNGTLSFSPTQNWAVNWVTSYDITDGEFGAHSLRLVRDLYRWQANFSFYRTPVGNTSFEFSVHLKDLPDLKLDYNERDIGVDRRGR